MQIELLGLTGVLLCSAHMCLGVWIGYWLNRPRSNDEPQGVRPPFYLPDMLELIEQSRRLHRAFTLHQHQVPAGMKPAVLQVFHAAETLHKRVSSGPLLQPVSTIARAVPQPSVISSILEHGASSLSKREFMGFAQDAQCTTAVSDGRLGTDRRPYDTCQNIAFFSDALPAAHEFEQVQCNDLSVDGVSFFLNRLPDQERVVISLGTAPKLMFMTARIVNERLVYKDGRAAYRIGCQFLNRVEPPRYQWNTELGIIEPLVTEQHILRQE